MTGDPAKVSDVAVRDAIEGRTPSRPPAEADPAGAQPAGAQPAGPHADPALINPDATPGTGALTPPGEHDDVDSTSG